MNALADYKKIKQIAHALSDPNRLVILESIRTGKEWMNIFEIVQLSQPAISHHLKILKQADLINPEKTGRKITYTINRKVLSAFSQYLAAYAK